LELKTIFVGLAALTAFIMGMLSGYAIHENLFVAAGIIMGVGTLIVFTLGRLSGMKEMMDAILQQQTKETDAESDLF
jgi:hypothetical protein